MIQTLATRTSKLKSTLLGSNLGMNKRPIGVITYNKITGQVAQCEVFSTFWVGSAPSQADIATHLIGKGIGQVRYNTVKYASLV